MRKKRKPSELESALDSTSPEPEVPEPEPEVLRSGTFLRWKAPVGISSYGIAGKTYAIGADGILFLSEEDSDAVRSILVRDGFEIAR